MWWGGGGNQDDDRGIETGDGEDSPPLEILAEEEESESSIDNLSPRSIDSSLPINVSRPRPFRGSAMTSSTEKTELRDLHEQFQMQEDLLGHLKGVLKSNEEKLQMKDLEVEGYAMRLGKVRSRRSPGPNSVGSKSSLGSYTGLVMDTQSESGLEMFHKSPKSPVLMSDSFTASRNVHISTPSSNVKPGTGTIGQLRQQFDEMKAQENEEHQSRKVLENLVKQLQEELTDRDDVIREMKDEAMSVASFAYTASPFVMSPDGGRSPTTISPSRSPPLGCSVDSVTSFDFNAAAYSFDEKDNTILDLKEQAILLERRILDLEENLREKDQLIKARTQAVTLMSADLSAKGKSTLDQLDDTRQEMRKMQARFAEQEMAWKEKTSTLEVELDARSKRLQISEQACDRIEKARFELSTRNAALQEKIVSLQAEHAETKLKNRDELSKSEEHEKEMLVKIIQLEKSLEKEEKLRNERKTQFIEELKAAVDDSDVQNKIIELENKVTELEEEKGNLQLRLVDFEDMTVADGNLKDDLKESINKLQGKEDEIDDQVRTIFKLETESLDLIEALKDRDGEFSKMSSQISDLMISNEQLCMTKVKLEIRAVELEEQKDRWEEEKQELNENVEKLKKEVEVRLTAFEDIEKERDTLKIDIDNLNKIQIEYNLNQKYHDQEMVEKATKIKEQGIGLAEMEKLLQSKAEEIGNILMTLNSKQSELVTAMQNLEMVQTQNLQQGEENQRLSQMLNKDESHSQFLLANEQIQSLKCENENLQQQNRTFEKKADQLTLEYNAIELKLSENENKLSEDTETILILNSSKSDLEEIISQLKCDKQNLETKLNALSEELLSLKAAFDSEKQSIEHKLHNSDSQLAEAQSEHQSLTSINNEIQQKYADQTEFYESLKNKFNNLDGEYARSTNELENVHIQLKYSEAKLDECKVDLNESAAVIKKLTDQCQNFQNTNNALQSQLDANSTELEEKAKSITLLEEQNTNSDLELSNVRSQIDELTLSSMSLEDSRNFMNESNTTKVFELQNTIAEKESEISHLKLEVQELEDESKNNGSKETQMPHDIQEFHTTISAKENQIQEIKEALDELKLEYEALNAQKERLTNETEIEINACMNTIASNEEAINLMKSELENEQARKLIELTEMKEEIETTKNKNEDLSNQIQTEKKNSLILQQNYNQLLANSEMNDSTKELINERDKAVKKSTLLTDKCKKLITKCKQQENRIQGQEKEVEANLEAMKLEIDKTKAELETKSTTLDAVILERQNFEDANIKVTEEMKLLQEKLSHSDFEKKTVDEKWETEMMEKDLVIEDLRNQMKEKESTIQHNAKNALSEMQERIDFLEEAYEAQGNDKSNAEEQVEKVKEKLARLTSERSELYETQISLKEELLDLKKENSRLSASLEDTKREIGKIRQTNIVSQMLDSPLLQAVAQGDQSLQTEKDSKDKKDEDQKNLEVGDNVSATKIPKEDIEEVFRDNDSFSGFDNNDNGNGGWDNDQIDIDEFEEDAKFVDEKSSIKLTDPKLAPSVIDINFEKHENKSLDVNDEAGEGWGGWDDEELDLGSNTEVEEVKNVQEHESVAQENESSIPPVFHTTRAMLPANTMPILSHDDPPASLISNVSGWGDDDGFGWGNEEDLPGNLRLSAERDMVEMKDEKAQKEDTPSKDVENATHNLPLVGSTEGNIDQTAKLIEKESYIESLESSLERLKERLNTVEEKLASKEEAKDEAERTVIKLGEELRERESRLEILSKETQEQENVLASTQLSATTCMERLDISGEMIEDYKKRIDELSNEQQSLQLELVSSYEELEELRSLKPVKNELEAAKEKIENFENYKEEWQSELSKSEDALELARTELQNINDQLEAAEEEKNELKDRVLKLGTRQESIDDRMETLEGENGELRHKMEDARENIDQLQMTITQLEGKTNELERDLLIEKANLDEKNTKIEELNDLISSDNTTERLIEAESELVELKGITQNLQEEKDELEKEIAQKLQNLEQQNEIYLDTNQELEKARSLLSDKHSEIEHLRRELTNAFEHPMVPQQMQNQQQLHQMQNQPQVLHDLAEVNRPPPDVTHQGLLQHPDVANHELVTSTHPPDLMPLSQQQDVFQQQPPISLQANNMFDLVQGNQGFAQDSFNPAEVGFSHEPFQQNVDGDDGSWFDNLQPVVVVDGEHEQLQVLDIPEVQNVVEAVENMPTEAEKELACLREQKCELQARITNQFQEISTLQERLQSHDNENVNLQSKLDETDKECDSLKTKMEQMQEERNIVEEQIRLKEDESNYLISQRAEGNSSLQALLKEKTDECSELHKQLSFKEESYLANIDKLQGDAKALQENIKEREQNYTMLLVQIQEKEREINQLQGLTSEVPLSAQNLEVNLTANIQEAVNIPSTTPTEDVKEIKPVVPEEHQSPPQTSVFTWDDQFGRQSSTSDPFNFDQQTQGTTAFDFFPQTSHPHVNHLQSSEIVQNVAPIEQFAQQEKTDDGTNLREEMLNLQCHVKSLQGNLDKSENDIDGFKLKLIDLEGSLRKSYEENIVLETQIQTLPSLDKFENMLKEKDNLASMLNVVQSTSKNLEEEIEKLKNSSALKDSLSIAQSSEPKLDKSSDFLVTNDAMQTIEETFSASNYFSQVDQSSTTQNMGSEIFSQTSEDLKSNQHSLAEAQPPTEQDPEVSWYKTELERYQQAISDWQNWSESQTTEFANLNQTLIQYTEAYNTSATEVTNLQEEITNLKSSNKSEEDGNEVSKLKGQVKTKDIEIDDLTETLDRLTSEKEELQQEIDDLVKQNEELRCSADEQGVENMVDVSLYDETKISLDEANDRCRQLTMEIGVAKEALDHLNKSKLEDSAMLQQLKEELEQGHNNKKDMELELNRISNDHEVKCQDFEQEITRLKEEVKSSAENIEHLVKQLDEAKVSIQEKENKIADVENIIEKTNAAQSANQELEQVDNQQSNVEGELEMCKKYLQDWSAWGEEKTEEVNDLQKAYDECQMSYNTLNEELVVLKECNTKFEKENNELEETQNVNTDSEDEIKRQIDNLQLQNSELNDTLSKTQDQLNENGEKVTSMLDDIQGKEKELVRLKNELETHICYCQECAEDNTETKSDLRDKLSNTQSKLDAHVEKLESTTNDIKVKEEEILSLKNDIESHACICQKCTNNDTENSTEASEEVTEGSQNIIELKAQFEATNLELQTCQQYLQDWHNWSEQRNQEYDALNTAYNESNEAFQAQSLELSNLKEGNNSLQEEIYKIKDTLQVKETELQDIKACSSDDSQLRNALEGKQIEIDAMEQMNRELQNTVSQLQEEIRNKPIHEDMTKEISGIERKTVVNDESTEGWGADDEVLVQANVSDNNETILQLEGEISDLRHKLRTSEESKATLQEELNSAKIKHGKLAVKVKTLTKDLKTARGQKGKSSSPEDNLLEMAIQEELKSQVTQAEKEATEFKKQVKELKDMELSYSSLKGRVEELENVLSHTRQERDELSGRVIELQLQIDTLVEEQEILQNVDVEKNRLKEECESLKLRLESLQTEKSEVPSLPTIITTTDSSSMHQTNQMKEEYDHFQETNQHLQSEIESLRTCIDDQTAMNDELQRQLNTFQQLGGQKLPGDNLSIDQIQASGYFETTPGHGGRTDQGLQGLPPLSPLEIFHKHSMGQPQSTASQLHAHQIPSTPATMSLQQQMGDRERHESASTDRESEIRRIFDQDPLEVSAQNERLQHDLDQSMVENKNMTKQMQSWKEQLMDIGIAGDNEPSDQYMSPSVLRSRQDNFARSVAALQLRVEELTLEVTKLLEERDTLQLKLSNVMRQFERHKDSMSRASTACSTPVPWFDPKIEVMELRTKIEQLGKLNYALDIALQQEREGRKQLQANLRLGAVNYNVNPPATPSRQSATPSPEAEGAVIHL